MYWLFNKIALNITRDTRKLSWEQKSIFPGEVGDRVIVFEFSNKAHFFSYLFTITSTNKEELQKKARTTNQYEVVLSLKLEKDFETEKIIDDYIFSFPRIVYFGKYLYRHFNRKYYRLKEEEFSAIINDEIFEPRSILGAAVNAMHIDHRRAFSQLLVERFPQVLQNRYNHSDLLALLNEYLRFAVILPAIHLAEAFNDVETIVDGEILNELAFADEATRANTENIAAQVIMINETIADYQNSVTITQENIFRDFKFDRIFRNRPLPIDLNG